MASRQRVQKLDRMGATGLWRWSRLLLLLLYVSGFQAVSIMEKKVCLIEGNNLTEICPYNIMKYASSLKAWQRVRSQGPPETLVRTKTRNTDINQAQAGRYLLEDFPTEAVVKVTVTGLQRQDKGLYQCVIDLSPRDPVILHDRIRLVHCDDSSGTTVLNKNPIQTLVETTTLPLTTATMTPRTPLLRPRTVTKPLSTSTAIFSSPGLRNNFTNVGDVTRVSVFSIVTLVVCGILSKSLVFTVLLVVTQRSAAL
ncbi:triggering receptor expressed on myeloid cells 1 isoform X2 [Trichechus manatus latirostris]|uniref:Triggering receptor expressed on myeloid cells 1 isoform X2 n=3 Tax=Trichechus manatus latirostris TaxID=127582 RepID=A0A2Y9R631_TRIMA|nr:triggering receptor expressed on myeloid cells 1 isoform X2 [Trichechus manatus latirostris]